MIEVNDIKGLFQPKWFYASILLVHFKSQRWKVLVFHKCSRTQSQNQLSLRMCCHITISSRAIYDL